MADNQDFFRNTVSSKGQLKENEFVFFHIKENEHLRVLFVGNSITRHGVCESVGWYRDCGMAASCVENDYVHQTVKKLEERYGAVSFCIAQVSEWENNFCNDTVLEKYRAVLDFHADVAVIRIGENVHCTDEELVTCDFYTHYDKMAKFFFGNAKKKVVTGLFWARGSLEREIQKVAEENKYCFAPISYLGDREDCKALTEYAHIGVACHPNDLGMEKIAQAILSALEL